MSFKPKFTRMVEGFSTNRRMPRLGKIRLGVKVKNASGREYPRETNHFVCPVEVQRIYGECPTELDVMLPLEDTEIVFPQKLAMYGASKGLVCHGNGQIAERKNETTGEWEERACPCEFRKTKENPKGHCSETAHLMVILPKVNMGGIYQISTGSYHSVIDLNSGLDYVKALIGRVAMVPLKLRREARETHHDGKKQTHYTLTLRLDANIEGLNKLREDTKRILETAHYQIEGPVETGPEADPIDIIDDDEEGAIEGEVLQSQPAITQVEPEPSHDIKDNMPFEAWLDFMNSDEDGKAILRKVQEKMRLKSFAHLPPDKQNQVRLTGEDYLREMVGS